MTLGDRLRESRERHGFTQVGVSQRIGINNKTLSGYEKNIGTPSPDTLAKLANLYEVSLDYLIKGTDMIRASDDDKKEVSDILDEFKRQMEGKPLSDEEKKRVLDVAMEVILKTQDKRNHP